MRSIEPGISRFRVRSFGPSRNDEDGGDTYPHSRGAFSPELCEIRVPPEKRARGMPGDGLTHGPPATKNRRQSPGVKPDHPTFPAQWFYSLFRALLGVPGLIASVAREIVHELVPSVGGTGPHGLTVRLERIRLPRQSVHRIPRSTLVTMAKRPSLPSTGRREIKHVFRISETRIFLSKRLDSELLEIRQVFCPSCRSGNTRIDQRRGHIRRAARSRKH